MRRVEHIVANLGRARKFKRPAEEKTKACRRDALGTADERQASRRKRASGLLTTLEACYGTVK